MRSAITLILLIILCLGGGGLSGISSADSIGTWYQDLNQPFFTPPGWLFGPAWSILYTLMAVACWRVWKKSGNSFKAMGTAGLLFFGQLALNFLWTPVFFGMHAIELALVVIVLLWIAIALTMRAFARIDRLAALLLIPYLAWVTFATALNIGFAILN